MMRMHPIGTGDASLGVGDGNRREMTAASDIYCLPQQREIEVESRAFFRRTLHANFARMLLSDPVSYREPEPRTALLPILRHILRGEKGIVNALKVFLRNAQPGVGDDHAHTVAVRSHDPQRASVRHGVFCV